MKFLKKTCTGFLIVLAIHMYFPITAFTRDGPFYAKENTTIYEPEFKSSEDIPKPTDVTKKEDSNRKWWLLGGVVVAAAIITAIVISNTGGGGDDEYDTSGNNDDETTAAEGSIHATW